MSGGAPVVVDDKTGSATTAGCKPVADTSSAMSGADSALSRRWPAKIRAGSAISTGLTLTIREKRFGSRPQRPDVANDPALSSLAAGQFVATKR